MRIGTWAALLVAALAQAFGQSQAPAPKLEVASVKPHKGELPRTGGKLETSGTRITVRGYSVLGLLLFAYNVRMDQISSQPLLDQTMYDIDAEAPSDRALTKDEFRLLMQVLLADRFKLKAHRESTPRPVYALIVGKNGPKFKESAPDATPGWEPARDGHNIGSSVRRSTMADLANRLSSSAGLDRPVIDKTGLPGFYDFRLTYTARERLVPGDPEQVDVFDAVEQQLGLKLDPRTAPFEMLIVDHIERPSEN